MSLTLIKRLSMTETRKCCLCDKETDQTETSFVRSNVRRFSKESFPVWRCGFCGSIHSDIEVDLDEYYRCYPFFGKKLDWTFRAGYRQLHSRLRHGGLQKGASILDYGCGSGLLVDYLKEMGYDAHGYDPYSPPFDDESVLDRQYDCVAGQDVLEHVDSPRSICNRLDEFVHPGGLVALGTPNASGIDLANAEKYVHSLHQPYHRHICSIEILLEIAKGFSWETTKYYSTPYTNMIVLSLPFLHHFMKSNDGTLEVLFERSNSRLFWFNPKTWFLLFFGYFLCDNADIFVVFKKSGASNNS